MMSGKKIIAGLQEAVVFQRGFVAGEQSMKAEVARLNQQIAEWSKTNLEIVARCSKEEKEVERLTEQLLVADLVTRANQRMIDSLRALKERAEKENARLKDQIEQLVGSHDTANKIIRRLKHENTSDPSPTDPSDPRPRGGGLHRKPRG